MNEKEEGDGFFIVIGMIVMTYFAAAIILTRTDENIRKRLEHQTVTVINKEYIESQTVTRRQPIPIGKSIGVRVINEEEPEKYILYIKLEDGTTKTIDTSKVIYQGAVIGDRYKYLDLKRR